MICNERFVKYWNYVSANNNSVLYNLSKLAVILSKSRKVQNNTHKHLPSGKPVLNWHLQTCFRQVLFLLCYLIPMSLSDSRIAEAGDDWNVFLQKLYQIIVVRVKIIFTCGPTGATSHRSSVQPKCQRTAVQPTCHRTVVQPTIHIIHFSSIP